MLTGTTPCSPQQYVLHQPWWLWQRTRPGSPPPRPLCFVFGRDIRLIAVGAADQEERGWGREKWEASLQSSERRQLGGPGRQEKWHPQH